METPVKEMKTEKPDGVPAAAKAGAKEEFRLSKQKVTLKMLNL